MSKITLNSSLKIRSSVITPDGITMKDIERPSWLRSEYSTGDEDIIELVRSAFPNDTDVTVAQIQELFNRYPVTLHVDALTQPITSDGRDAVQFVIGSGVDLPVYFSVKVSENVTNRYNQVVIPYLKTVLTQRITDQRAKDYLLELIDLGLEVAESSSTLYHKNLRGGESTWTDTDIATFSLSYYIVDNPSEESVRKLLHVVIGNIMSQHGWDGWDNNYYSLDYYGYLRNNIPFMSSDELEKFIYDNTRFQSLCDRREEFDDGSDFFDFAYQALVRSCTTSLTEQNPLSAIVPRSIIGKRDPINQRVIVTQIDIPSFRPIGG